MTDRRNRPRTHYIHRINYSMQERIVGTFVLVAVGILVWLLFSSGGTSSIFEDNFIIYGKLETAKAVNVDTEVLISGISAGRVTSVDITEDNNIILTMKMLTKYQNLLRTDSIAELTSFDLAVIGKSIIEITVGSPDKPLLTDGDTIDVTESVSIKKLLDRATPAITSLEESITKMNQILSAVDTHQLEQSMNNMHRISTDLRDISEHIRAGKGLAGSMIYDDEFQQQIQTSMKNLEQASVKVNNLMTQAEQQLGDMPELLQKVGPLLEDAHRTIKATQRIWPMSSAVEEEGEPRKLTSPAPAND